MSRPACVDLPAFPLQLLLRKHPDWRDGPAASLGSDGAMARVEWVNRAGVRQGVRPGMRQATALAACPALRVGWIPEPEVRKQALAVAARLQRWSPQVELAASLAPLLDGCGAAGTFWLEASGLSTLFGSLPEWVESIRKDLVGQGLQPSVAVGFSRFGSFAAARASFGVRVFSSPEQERLSSGQTPLVRFGLAMRTLETLDRLGIRCLRDLLRQPAGELGSRFGIEVARLHRLAFGEIERMAGEVFRPESPVERRVDFEPPEADGERLLFQAKRLVDGVLAGLGRRGLVLRKLAYRITDEDGKWRDGVLVPAEPSPDSVQILSLLRLRFGSEFDRNGRRIAGLAFFGHGGAAVSEQPGLFGTSPRWQRRAIGGLARIQAEFGEGSLFRIEKREGHLPADQYRCRPVPADRVFSRRKARASAAAEPPPDSGTEPVLLEGGKAGRVPGKPAVVRRIYEEPLALPLRNSTEPDGWLFREVERGAVMAAAGPYRISGGWWRRLSGRPVARDYYFASLKTGEVCWVFHDREKGGWFLEGRVE